MGLFLQKRTRQHSSSLSDRHTVAVRAIIFYTIKTIKKGFDSWSGANTLHITPEAEILIQYSEAPFRTFSVATMELKVDIVMSKPVKTLSLPVFKECKTKKKEIRFPDQCDCLAA